MRIVRSVGIAVALVASCVVLVASPASAKPNKLQVPSADYPTIQSAVDAAGKGDTIVIAPGLYHEDVTIEKDNITIVGDNSPTESIVIDGEFCGICVGRQDDVVVKNTKITGVNLVNAVFGLFAYGTKNLVIDGVVAEDNEEYGVARFESEGGKIVNSVAVNGGEAGFYVGDSPKAHVDIKNNFSTGSLFGFFLRDSSHAKVHDNEATGNCVGMLVADFGSGEAQHWDIHKNDVYENNKYCEANEEEEQPALSGIGILLIDAKKSNIHDNNIWGNVASGSLDDVPSAGIVVASFGGGLTDLNIHKNTLADNGAPDIFWTGQGTKIKFKHNSCTNGSAIDPNLCD